MNLFVGDALEGGPANLVLRRHETATAAVQSTRLLGPRSPTAWRFDAGAGELEGAGEWQGLRYRVALRLAAGAPAWFWHVHVENASADPVRFDLLMLQDLRWRRMRPCGSTNLLASPDWRFFSELAD